VSLPVYVARAQVASALHVVVQLLRFADGSRRVQSISEMLGLSEDNTYRYQDLFRFKAEGLDTEGKLQGKLVPTGVRPTFSGEPFFLGYGDRVKLTKDVFVEAAE
jgi:pilus assembly protein CpaF